MNHYEQAGIVFYSEKNHLMASNLFIKGIEIEPDNSMLWYGLGDSLCHISINTKQDELYPIGLSCVKKSYSIDNNNRYANAMFDRMKINPNVGEEYLDKLELANIELISKFKFEIPNEKLISFFEQIQNIENKIKLVMHLGETSDKSYFGLLKHCISNETNPHIKFSALKRIPHYKEDNLQPFFEDLVLKNKQTELEPYFSIALSEINEDWCKKYINSQFAYTNEEHKSFTEEDINKSLKNDEVRAIIALGLIKYDKQEIEKLYQKKNHKTLAFYLTNGMNDDGIDFLFRNHILDKRGNILEIGWKHIEQFLQVDFSKPLNEKEPKKDMKTEIPKPKTSVNKKNWWEFWK